MGDQISETNLNLSKSMEVEVVNIKQGGDQAIKEEDHNSPASSLSTINRKGSCFSISVPFLQKLIAEALGTYFVVFAGGASIVVNVIKDGQVTPVGISVVWGLVVMVMIYSVGHISGAHFNPAVSIAFAANGRFSWKQVPGYVTAQLLGSTLASVTLRLLFGAEVNHFFGTAPTGSNIQSFVLEFIISFYLMFVISGVATDNRAIGELAGLAVGATILLIVIIAGLISGSSMNPARSLGPAIVLNRYKSIWVYIVAPICGMVCGAWTYNLIRFTDKSFSEISFLRSVGSLRNISIAKKKEEEFSL
ncbi:aquaporin NIP1-1-like [Macadamia integrifolia]|uniref:aquaporin NIP1-1-like n=1 Tax=Macadamia integrifolia TaxID=60698 RepID=UPI001C531284|nr:aquaporin NIP1-1-like [Macadamia integrifolia]